jgi:hypothetical protein
MLVADLLLVTVVAFWARRLWPRDPLRPLTVVTLYALTSALLWPVLFMRFDLVPVALTMFALYLTDGRRAVLGSFVLGIAAATKLWPIALLPLLVHRARTTRGLGTAGTILLAFTLGAAAPVLPLVALAGPSATGWLGYHVARGIQIESLWASVALLLRDIAGIKTSTVFEYGAFHLAGSVPRTFALLSLPATVVCALLPLVLFVRTRRSAQVPLEGRAALLVSTGTCVGLLCASKVLSPQLILCALPLLALTAHQRTPTVALVALCGCTMMLYPHFHLALAGRAPGYETAVLVLTLRNLLLAYLYRVTLTRIRGLSHRRTTKTLAVHAVVRDAQAIGTV